MNWIIFALLAAFIIGMEDILKKKVLKKSHSYEFLTLVYMAGFLMILPFFKFAEFNVPVEFASLIFIRSILLAISFVAFTKSLKHLPISTVAPLSNFKPLFTLLLAFIILNETIGVIQVLGIFVIIFGSYILDSEGHLKNYHKPLKDLISSKYIQYIIVFAVFYSLSQILAKIILIKVKPFTMIFLHMSFSVLIYLFITFVVFKGIKDLAECWKIGKYWIIVIAFLGFLMNYTIFLALGARDSMVSLVVPIVQMSALFELIIGGRLFKEKNIAIKGIACVLMIIGVVLLFV